ncbi:MAG: PilZ domain-containing protein [Candidatus Omnitrophica bacterium]|nr:PilZ domain-containing protein [Candidatus Omnitrophota bacterium]
MEEKRRYRRLNRSFITKFRLSADNNASSSVNLPAKWDIVTIRNISGSGMAFIYHKPFVEGVLLEFEITVASLHRLVKCLGVVCRVDSLNEAKPGSKIIPLYGIAVHYTEITREEQEAIDRVVEAFING